MSNPRPAARIFIVEDEALVAMELEDRLCGMGYEVCGRAARGAGAVDAIVRAEPDLVLMDIRLADDVTGIDVAEQLRVRSDVPVVFLTAYSDDDLTGRARRVQPFGFLVKPFQEREVRVNIEIALYKHAAERELVHHRERLEELVRERTRELESANRRLALEITERKAAEDELRAIRDALAARVDSRTEELERATEALRESRELFDLFMTHSPAIGFVKDDLGRLVYVSPSYVERILGDATREWRGKTTGELWPDAPAAVLDVLQAHDAEVLAHGHSTSVEELIPTRAGAQSWLTFRFPIPRPDGTRFVAGMALDITERKQLEERLTQAQKMDAIGRLAGGVAHDFNNLLTAILVSCEFALGNLEDDHAVRVDVERAKGAAERAAALTRRLLAFSRHKPSQRQVVELTELVGDVTSLLRRVVPEDVALITHVDPGPFWVKADAGQLEQVIMNLVLNARDALPSGGEISITLRHATDEPTARDAAADAFPGRCVALSVRDTGVGMPPEVMRRIFEPFFTTKAVGAGTGLGLTTAYGIVRDHDGQIWAESEVGVGSTFWVLLPFTDAPATTSATAQESPTARPGETILVVEDEPAVRLVAKALLERLGYVVLAAGSGPEALPLVEAPAQRIDLLLLDVVMPEMSGPEVAERALAIRPGLRVLFASGHTEHPSIAAGGAVLEGRLVAKPFTTSELAQRVRAALDETPPTQ